MNIQFIQKYNDAMKNRKHKVLIYLSCLIICNIYLVLKVDFFNVISNAWMANYAFIHMFIALVLSIVVIVNYVYIYKLKKCKDETKIKKYESKGIYFGKGKYLVLLGIVLEIVIFFITKKYYYNDVIGKEVHILFYIVLLALCFKYAIISFKSKKSKIISAIFIGIVILLSLEILDNKLVKFDSYMDMPAKFEISDPKKFGGEWEINENKCKVRKDFLVHKEKLKLSYTNEEDLSPYYHFYIYYTDNRWLNDYLVKNAFKEDVKGDYLYGTFAYIGVYDLYDGDPSYCISEEKELEKDGVKVFYKGLKNKTRVDNVEYLIYDNKTIIFLKCDYILTETQMDIIIDSMKSMEEKL